MSKKLAFTLAEVLIVIGIIGIVAEMIVPSLVAKTEEKIIATQVKEVYSVLSQALKMSEITNGTPDMWACPNIGGGDDGCGLNKFTPYLQVAKNCGMTSGCFPPVAYKKINGSASIINFDTWPNLARARLKNGMSIAMGQSSGPSSSTSNANNLALKNIYGEIDVDINGDKPPNRFGKDLFVFWYTKYGIVPAGTKDEDGSYPLSTDCSNKSGIGDGCAAWLIYKENMDYMNGAVSW